MNTTHSTRQTHDNTLLTNGVSVLIGLWRLTDVVFHILRFAFAAYFAPHNDYLRVINRAAPVQSTLAAPCDPEHGDVS